MDAITQVLDIISKKGTKTILYEKLTDHQMPSQKHSYAAQQQQQRQQKQQRQRQEQQSTALWNSSSASQFSPEMWPFCLMHFLFQLTAATLYLGD
ncbi:hypothetical protein QQG55_17555 [Brugia pahangi]|uniref:Uncharacterized protein n=1 Tax=Brugia pahangi TaxID=6280 RepID=A0A0N4T3C5_BRUPA|nr:unnamed protein product [Brugia pahangi]